MAGAGRYGKPGQYGVPDMPKWARKYYEPGSQAWMEQQYAGQEDQFALLQNIIAQQGALKLDIPDFNVRQGDKYTKMFQATGRREGDIAAQGVSNAMAGRGGGNIGGSLAMQSQARAGASAQGLAQGVGYDFQQYQMDLSDYMTRLGIEQTRYGAQMSSLEAQRAGIQNALATRFNILNMIIGARAGDVAANAQMQSADTAADAQVTSAMWNVAGQLGGAALSRPW